MLEDLSACIIAKNEEKNLPRLLRSIKGKFSEIILVDTGSSDNTVEIAKSFGCKVFYRKWDGFADARNFAVEKASGKWVWHFDADTELEESEYERFKTFYNLFDKDIYEGMAVIYKNVSSDGRARGFSTTVHIHKKSEKIKWIGKVHERVINLDKQNILIPNFMVKVIHYGYSLNSVQKNKAIRNLKLVFDELRSIKDKNSFDYMINLFYAIQSYIALSSIENKEKNLKRSIKYIKKFCKNIESMPKDSMFLKHFYVYASSIYKELNQLDDAKAILEEGLSIDDSYPDLLYLLGEVLDKYGNTTKAIDFYIKFLESIDKIKAQNILVIIDYLPKARYLALEKLPRTIVENIPEYALKVEKKWKESRGLYIGLLFYSLKKEDNFEKAENILKKLSRLYPDEDIIFTLLGKMYEVKYFDKAAEYMGKAIQINPLNPDANLFFAKLHESNQNILEALNFYKCYLEATRDVGYLQKIQELLDNIKKNSIISDNKT